MEGTSSDCVGNASSAPAAVSSGGSLSRCEDIDSGDGSRAGVFRLAGAGFATLAADVKPSDHKRKT